MLKSSLNSGRTTRESSSTTNHSRASDGVVPVRPAWAYPKRGIWIALRWPLLLFALGAIAIPTVDRPMAVQDFHTTLPRFVAQVVNHTEMFGSGAGVPFFLAAVWMLDPARRRMLPRLACASWGAGIAANLVKLCVTRQRPFYWIGVGSGGIGEQFGDWFPLAGNGSANQSFPSAHTATAVGLALGLTALYPRGGRFFGALAALVALQRSVGDMHFISDTLFASGLAMLVCLVLYRYPGCARAFERFEAGPSRVEGPAETRRAA